MTIFELLCAVIFLVGPIMLGLFVAERFGNLAGILAAILGYSILPIFIWWAKRDERKAEELAKHPTQAPPPERIRADGAHWKREPEPGDEES